MGLTGGTEGEPASVAWSGDDPTSLDYLGNEFLVWIWHVLQNDGETVRLADGSEVTVMLAKTLTLDCPRGETGRDQLTDDSPTRLPEAFRALQAGKLPRKAGMILVRHGAQYELTLQAETLAVSAAALPKPDDDGLSRHEQRRFEHVLALGLEGEARRGGVDRRLERGGHLALRRPRKRLALRGVLDAAHASQPDAALARDGPAHGSRARDSRIVIHDHDARAECLVWSLDYSRRTVGLSTQRVDDHAGRPECLRERRQRCVLFLPRSVQPSDSPFEQFSTAARSSRSFSGIWCVS